MAPARNMALTVTQAAAILGLSGARVRVLIAEGRIPAEKVSPRLYLVHEPVAIAPPLPRTALEPGETQ